MKTRIPSSILLALSLSLPQVTAEDLPKPWVSVAFKVLNADKAASVTIEGDRSLSKVNVSLIGSSMDVPEDELEGIDRPKLDTAELLFGEDWYGEWKEGEEATPHYIVKMTYGKQSKFGAYPTVKFLFHSGKYQGRTTTIQDTETVWKIFTKLPGEEVVATGTATRAPHRPPTTIETPDADQ